MSTALSSDQRAHLERLVLTARRLLEEDLAAQAEGRFGLHLDGRIEQEGALHLDPTSLLARRQLVDVIQHLRTLGEDAARATARLIREASFTHLNRLVAIRIAEATGLLPQTLAKGSQSAGFRQLADVAPLAANDYWAYLMLCGDELAADAPDLFDPRNPLLSLVPAPGCVDRMAALFADAANDNLWHASDTLGWTYQFFNTGNERRAMREASSAPRDSRELAVRNQFFTPRYVVDFLVQNTLGRRLIESDPSSPLLDETPLLVDPPTEPGPAMDLDQVKVLDPACGSGHFLLGCYDLLERAWSLRGVPPAEAAPRIVDALWGVDIDPRCAQIATATIILRARRACRTGPLPVPHVITARSLPIAAPVPDEDLDANLRRLVEVMADALSHAPLLGVLLKAEERMEAEVRGMEFGPSPGVLQLTDEAFEDAERRLLEALRRVADSTTASVAERLFAAEAGDAVRLIDVCRTRFDVVLMNPPFGEPVPETRPYLRDAYGPASRELAACFVQRARHLLNEGGRIGVLATRLVLFVDGLEGWRRNVLLGDSRLKLLLDLGIGVLQGALVEVAAMTVAASDGDEVAAFVRLLDSRDKEGALIDAIATPRRVDLNRFRGVGKASIPYWLGDAALAALSTPGWSAAGLEAKTGPQTDDDFRLLRLRWEVEESPKPARWIPVAKGGEYEPYWDDIHLMLDWDNWPKRPRSKESYVGGGLSYPYRTTSDHCLRILPQGCGFTRGGPAIHGDPESLLLTLASCFTRPYKILVEAVIGGGDSSVSGSAARNYSAPWLATLPALVPKDPDRDTLLRAVNEAIERSWMLSSLDETSALFVGPVPGPTDGVRSLEELVVSMRKLQASAFHARLTSSVLAEQAYFDASGLSRQACDELWGTHPEDLPDDEPDHERLLELWGKDERELVDLGSVKK